MKTWFACNDGVIYAYADTFTQQILYDLNEKNRFSSHFASLLLCSERSSFLFVFIFVLTQTNAITFFGHVLLGCILSLFFFHAPFLSVTLFSSVNYHFYHTTLSEQMELFCWSFIVFNISDFGGFRFLSRPGAHTDKDSCQHIHAHTQWKGDKTLLANTIFACRTNIQAAQSVNK